MMKVLSKVLWAVDINEDHSQSLSKVVKTAELFGSEIILLHVLQKEIEGSVYQETVERGVMADLSQLANRIRARGDYQVRSLLAYGNIAERILDLAEEEDVNVIFLNRGKDSEGSGGKLGIYSQKVARLSLKPVAIISNQPTVENPHIVVPVDFSGPSALALNSAILHARKTRAKLTVITVFEPVSITSPHLVKMGVNEEAENEYKYQNLQRELNDYLQQFDFTGVDMRKEVLRGIAHLEIIWYINLATILYMGSTGKTGLRRTLMGSVSEKVINEVEANVVLIKSEELFKLRIPADLEDIQKHYDRGTELVSLGFYQDAISQYHLCLGINDLHLPSIWALATLYEKTGNRERQKYYRDLGQLVTQKMEDRRIEEEIRRSMRSAG